MQHIPKSQQGHFHFFMAFNLQQEQTVCFTVEQQFETISNLQKRWWFNNNNN